MSEGTIFRELLDWQGFMGFRILMNFCRVIVALFELRITGLHKKEDLVELCEPCIMGTALQGSPKSEI